MTVLFIILGVIVINAITAVIVIHIVSCKLVDKINLVNELISDTMKQTTSAEIQLSRSFQRYHNSLENTCKNFRKELQDLRKPTEPPKIYKINVKRRKL